MPTLLLRPKKNPAVCLDGHNDGVVLLRVDQAPCWRLSLEGSRTGLRVAVFQNATKGMNMPFGVSLHESQNTVQSSFNAACILLLLELFDCLLGGHDSPKGSCNHIAGEEQELDSMHPE